MPKILETQPLLRNTKKIKLIGLLNITKKVHYVQILHL